MTIVDYLLPHRQLINGALRKASAELSERIGVYQIEYERAVARCEEELKIEVENKNREFERAKQAFSDQLSGEGLVLESIQPIFFKYVDEYRLRQLLFYQKKKTEQQIQLIKEHIDFLFNQIALIKEDVNILSERRDILSAQCNVDDIISLINLTECDFVCDETDDAKTLLDKVNASLDCANRNNTSSRSLLRLRVLLYERAEYLPVIQYITWLIQQRNRFITELRGQLTQLKKEKNSLYSVKNDVQQQINIKDKELTKLANDVRDIWAKPLATISIERARVEAELTQSYDSIAQLKAAIQQMKSESSDDSDRWEWLQAEKKNTKIDLITLKNEKESLLKQIEPWNQRRKTIFGICKKYDVYLFLQKNGDSDEIRVLKQLRNECEAEIEALRIESEQETLRKKNESDQTLNELDQQIQQLSHEVSRVKQQLSDANKAIALAKKHDDRNFFAKIFSDSYEVLQAEKKKSDIQSKLNVKTNRLNELQNKRKAYANDLSEALLDICKQYQHKINALQSRINSINKAIDFIKNKKRKKVVPDGNKI